MGSQVQLVGDRWCCLSCRVMGLRGGVLAPVGQMFLEGDSWGPFLEKLEGWPRGAREARSPVRGPSCHPSPFCLEVAPLIAGLGDDDPLHPFLPDRPRAHFSLALPSGFVHGIHADAPKAQGQKSFFVCKPHHPVLFLFSFLVSI